MTPENIALVQSNFNAVEPIADQAAELFYGRLFEIAPCKGRTLRGCCRGPTLDFRKRLRRRVEPRSENSVDRNLYYACHYNDQRYEKSRSLNIKGHIPTTSFQKLA